MPRPIPPLDLVQGTLDLLVLRALLAGPQHGYAIARRIQEATRDALRIEEGSLYPALHRMEERGWIKAAWGVSENNRRAKYYRLVAAGRRQLRAQASAWERFAAAVEGVLAMDGEKAGA
jgi:transcriptional regulator